MNKDKIELQLSSLKNELIKRLLSKIKVFSTNYENINDDYRQDMIKILSSKFLGLDSFFNDIFKNIPNLLSNYTPLNEIERILNNQLNNIIYLDAVNMKTERLKEKYSNTKLEFFNLCMFETHLKKELYTTINEIAEEVIDVCRDARYNADITAIQPLLNGLANYIDDYVIVENNELYLVHNNRFYLLPSIGDNTYKSTEANVTISLDKQASRVVDNSRNKYLDIRPDKLVFKVLKNDEMIEYVIEFTELGIEAYKNYSIIDNSIDRIEMYDDLKSYYPKAFDYLINNHELFNEHYRYDCFINNDKFFDDKKVIKDRIKELSENELVKEYLELLKNLQEVNSKIR